jgi:hypothetical protein
MRADDGDGVELAGHGLPSLPGPLSGTSGPPVDDRGCRTARQDTTESVASCLTGR